LEEGVWPGAVNGSNRKGAGPRAPCDSRILGESRYIDLLPRSNVTSDHKRALQSS
jgi:hypothetical protein